MIFVVLITTMDVNLLHNRKSRNESMLPRLYYYTLYLRPNHSNLDKHLTLQA